MTDTLLDRAGALEIARKTDWGHEFKPVRLPLSQIPGYVLNDGGTEYIVLKCDCGAVQDPNIPIPWCPVKLANALLVAQERTLVWADHQNPFGKSIYRAAEAARREKENK